MLGQLSKDSLGQVLLQECQQKSTKYLVVTAQKVPSGPEYVHHGILLSIGKNQKETHTLAIHTSLSITPSLKYNEDKTSPCIIQRSSQ